MPKINISAVVITFNEEANIKRCIESLLGVVEEIVVLDSFSTDRTREICEGMAVKFIQHPWLGYSDSKNYAHTFTSYDYILSLDADEALSAELRGSINAIKEQSVVASAYAVNRLTSYCGQWIRHGGWYPEWKIRLFKKDGAYWKGSIHEQLVLAHDTPVKRLAGDLLHYSFPSVDLHVKKNLAYATLVARRDIESGKHKSLVLHGLLKPAFFFLKQYFFKRGFLDGYYGFVIAILSTWERFMRYVKFKELKSR